MDNFQPHFDNQNCRPEYVYPMDFWGWGEVCWKGVLKTLATAPTVVSQTTWYSFSDYLI